MPSRKKNRWTGRSKKRLVASTQILDISENLSSPLTDLPLEIKRMIVKNFREDPVSSICLGITCKALMQLHREFHTRPVHLASSTFTADGCQRMLKFNLKDWMPCGLVFDCFRGKYVRPAVEATWGKKFDKAFAIEEAKFIAKSKRDMDRIAQRKKERRQFGYYYNEDRWSSFSALSEDPPYEIYNPTDGTCDGDSEHSRAYYQGEEDELEEEARMLRHMWGEYTASSSSDARDDNSEAGSSAAETSGDENSDSNLEPARDDDSAAGSDGVKSKGDEDPGPL